MGIITDNLFEIFLGISLFLNAGLLYLTLKYDILRKERKYRAIKLIKKLVKEMTDIELKSDDVDFIVNNIKNIEKGVLLSKDKEMKNIEKSEHLNKILENYFSKKILNFEKRWINFIAETMVNFVKKYGV